MTKIEAKGAPGRVARLHPNGTFFPEDRYITVEVTPYIRRLLEVHGDIVQKPPEAVTAPPKPVKPEAPKAKIKEAE